MEKSLRLRGLLFLCILLGLTACQEKDSAEPALDFTSVEFMLEDLDALAKPHLKDGCDKKAFSIHTTASARTEMHTLAYILPMLHLQADQANAIREFAKSHHSATSNHRGSVSMIHDQILAKANVQRDELMKTFSQGRLNAAQLEEKLLQLYDRVMEELTTHEAKQQHMRILREQRTDLMEQIETVLSPVQRQQWNNWRQQVQA